MNPDEQMNDLLKQLLKPTNIEPTEDVTLRDLFDLKLNNLGLSQRSVEISLEIEHKTLESILSQRSKRMDVINLIKLSHFLEVSLERIVELCMLEMPSDVIGRIAKTKASSYIVSNFDISHLRKGKFLKGRLTHEDIEKRIKGFFGFENIEEYRAIVPEPAYMRSKKSSNDHMRDFWITSAYRHFELLKNPNEYDRDLLVELMPKIRPYTMNVEKGLLTVVKALYNIGVTVIYQPHLPNVQAYGATFSVYNKPCVVLTDLNKNYPTIWFALLHELHHVLYDLDEITKRVFHITGEPDLFLIQEEKANSFAREYLFSEERSKYVMPLIFNSFVIKQVANEAQVHESFAYSFYNRDRREEGDKDAWKRFTTLIPKTHLAVNRLNSQIWEKETVEESVKFYKETVFNEAI